MPTGKLYFHLIVLFMHSITSGVKEGSKLEGKYPVKRPRVVAIGDRQDQVFGFSADEIVLLFASMTDTFFGFEM